MVNIKTLAFAALVTFSSLVAAEPCEDKVYYCSDELQELGDYDAAIDESLEGADQPVDDNSRNNSLFKCDANSKLEWIITCETGCTSSVAYNHYC